MGQFAPVAPLEVIKELSPTAVGNYHLLLAHDVLAKPKEYEKIFAGKGYEIIMDNSLIELGYPLPIREVLKAANLVGANYVVLPDVLSDFDATMQHLETSMAEIADVPWREKRAVEFMPVVQGKLISEVIAMLDWISKKGFSCVAIPRVLYKTLGSRRLPTYMAAKRGLAIHLLGFSEPDGIIDDVACCRMTNVMGIDSAVPIRLGLQRKFISLDEPVDAGSRGEYWNYPFNGSDRTVEMEKVSVVERNIATFRNWITCADE